MLRTLAPANALIERQVAAARVDVQIATHDDGDCFEEISDFRELALFFVGDMAIFLLKINVPRLGQVKECEMRRKLAVLHPFLMSRRSSSIFSRALFMGANCSRKTSRLT